MYPRRQRFLFAVSAVLSVAAAHAEDVILRLTPSEDAAIIARVDANSPAVKAARPVPEAEQSRNGWKWLEYTATLDGYIPTSSLSKNFEIELQTLVRAAPKATARVLTATQANDQFQVIASSDQWSTVRFRKAVPVYFRQHTLPAHTADQVPGHALPQRFKIDPNAQVANVSPSDLKPENVKWRAAPAGTPNSVLPKKKKKSSTARAKPSSIMTGSTDLQDSELPQSPEVQADAPIRNLVGTLVREISNTGPRYPIRLKSASGQRIAYVDMSHVFISDLRPVLNHSVQIIGEVRPLVPGSEELIIQARTIRITKQTSESF